MFKKISIYAAKSAINSLPAPEIGKENVTKTIIHHNMKHVFEFEVLDFKDPEWFMINYTTEVIIDEEI
jgi:hypothetical protein